jgi:hypothetical protein
VDVHVNITFFNLLSIDTSNQSFTIDVQVQAVAFGQAHLIPGAHKVRPLRPAPRARR